tara:strand:- start:5 stop:748 length:744 start_codon:yes stop_codon:yes gene_type:complete
MITLFVSDLHLSQQRPEKVDLFKKLLAGPAKNADAFYILGDLFDDFWIGCDDMRPPNPEIIATLREYSNYKNTQLYLMRGNRDFHINEKFAVATGCQIINDPTEIYLDNEKVLLMHGDTLCTYDEKYQNWRKFITNSLVKWIYSIMPLVLRQYIAHGVRGHTAKVVKNKPPEIIDVSQDSVINEIRKHDVTTLIHGHTHRQGIHKLETNEISAQRIVLGDWYEQDSILIFDKNDFRFERIESYIKNN